MLFVTCTRCCFLHLGSVVVLLSLSLSLSWPMKDFAFGCSRLRRDALQHCRVCQISALSTQPCTLEIGQLQHPPPPNDDCNEWSNGEINGWRDTEDTAHAPVVGPRKS